jgi:hypothetical protein
MSLNLLLLLLLNSWLQDIKFAVHAHPTLSEVLDELIKSAHVDAPSSSSNSSAAKAGAKQAVAA